MLINMSSYNYLGFSENSGPIVDMVENNIREYCVGVGVTRNDIGLYNHVINYVNLMPTNIDIQFGTNSITLACKYAYRPH